MASAYACEVMGTPGQVGRGEQRPNGCFVSGFLRGIGYRCLLDFSCCDCCFDTSVAAA